MTRLSALVPLALAAALATGTASGQPVWAEGPLHPVPRDHHATFLLDRGDGPPRLCVAGGNTYASVMGDVWCAYVGRDGTLADWRPEAPMPYGVAGSGLVVTDDAVILVSGRDVDVENTATVLVGHPTETNRLNSWVETTPFPAPVFHLTAERVGDWVYAIGGTTGTEAVDAVWRARLGAGGALGEWEPARSLPEPRSHHSSFVHGGALYVVGGMAGSPMGGDVLDRGTVLRAAVEASGDLGAWETVAELDSTRLAHASFVHDGHAYVVGGLENVSTPSDVVLRAALRPDGGLGPWEAAGTLPSARSHVHHAPMHGGHVYLMGGRVGRRVTGETLRGPLGR